MFTIFTQVPVTQRYSVGHVFRKQTDTTSAAHLPHAMRGYTPQLAVQVSQSKQTTKQLWTQKKAV